MWSAEENSPEFAIVDLRMPGPSGLTLIKRLKELDPNIRVVVLTGYGSIATAIEAIKVGATHYLAKPVRAEEIIAAFQRTVPDTQIEVTSAPLPVSRVEWEHIQKVLVEHHGNISATAKVLKMHRRTLQRKLAKHPVKGIARTQAELKASLPSDRRHRPRRGAGQAAPARSDPASSFSIAIVDALPATTQKSATTLTAARWRTGHPDRGLRM